MSIKKHVLAIFKMSKVISTFILDANTLKGKVTTPPGNTRITFTATEKTDFEDAMDNLVKAESNVKPEGDVPVADRDEALELVKTKVRAIVSKVQAAADAAPSELTSVAIVEDCGCKVKKVTPKVTPELKAKNVEGETGVIKLTSKAAKQGLKATYIWEYSLDGTAFLPIKVTTKSRYTWLSGLAAGTKVHFRKKVITNKDTGEPSWSQVIWIIVT